MLKKYSLYILVILMSPLPALAQYGGGAGRSEFAATLSTYQLDGSLLKIYAGGTGRGETMLMQSATQIDGRSLDIYGGGNGRGEFISSQNSNQLDGSSVSIYQGGVGRGEIISGINTNQLDGSILSLFGGGNGRGENVLTMNTNQLDGNAPNIYGGGIGRGDFLSGVYTIQLDGLLQNSMFLGGNGRGETMEQTVGVALPVTLISFSAALSGNQVNISWQTASESNSDYFLVERSRDGTNWQPIGQVRAAGHSDQPLSYLLVDPSPVEGINYYRLRPTDLDGKSTYSSVVAVHYKPGATTAVTVYPNPAYYEFTVALTGVQLSATLNLSLVDSRGQVVLEKKKLSGNKHTINISGLAAGIYYVLINMDGVVSVTKIIKK